MLYTNPLEFINYGYYNSISGESSLLGFQTFCPFYNPGKFYYTYPWGGLSYGVTIPKFDLVNSPYCILFPYEPLVLGNVYENTPLENILLALAYKQCNISPYKSFDYPYYSYGSTRTLYDWTNWNNKNNTYYFNGPPQGDRFTPWELEKGIFLRQLIY